VVGMILMDGNGPEAGARGRTSQTLAIHDNLGDRYGPQGQRNLEGKHP
jgi:hypothetical protein